MGQKRFWRISSNYRLKYEVRKMKNVFNKKMNKIIKVMTKKYGITAHRLLNYGGMIGAEFQENIKELKELENFTELFEKYINERK